MAGIKKVKTTKGETIEYVDEIIGAGGMKDVYFTPDKKNVVAFYRRPQDYNYSTKDRLENIVGNFNPTTDSATGKYWENLYCWPTKVVDDGKRLGIVAPAYQEHFFFKAGFNKTNEKEGKWFSSAKLRKMLDSSEKGDWFSYFSISILVSRAIRRMHTAGLAHSDLSYKNVLIDPKGRNAAIIDIDSLVVPEKFPPDVIGTPDFIAPEVLQTLKHEFNDKRRKYPSRTTDLHALAVLIYMYLLYRHPLRGGKVHDLDPDKDEHLSMGEKALFIEDPADPSNRPKDKAPPYMPWADPDKISYAICGPYLKKLFDRAFIDGLHNPMKRPLANEWEDALIKTVDLMQPCGNSQCEQKWFVFDNTIRPKCPFCGWKFKGQLPVLNLYSSRKQGRYGSDNHRLMVYHNQYLYPWHANRKVTPNEKLSPKDKKPVGYFIFHKGKWIFVNQTLTGMKDRTENKDIPIGSMVEMAEGKQILLSPEEGGRLTLVQMVNA
ncbi:serine/threonine-protein kinase [bacterium]|nr:serine/threonine-protein kinase [bacterium]